MRSRQVLLPAVLGSLVWALPASAAIPVVEVKGVIHAVSAAHVVQGLTMADSQEAAVVILRIDTPGGLDTSMRQIVDAILKSKTPVIVFVGPSGARAASAGFVIAMAADVVAMAPGTNMGAAHPVALGGTMDETMSKKVASDAAAYVRGKAERRGRKPELAEAAVLESRSFTEQEAQAGGLADLVVKDVPELLVALDGREVKRFDGTSVKLDLRDRTAVTVAMDWRQTILSAIATPEVLFLLLLGVLAGLGAEISHPGLIFPGVVGVVCLILFLFASQIIPVNWAGVLLVLLAVGLFVAEVKITSYGLLTVGGIVAMILGAMMLVDSPLPAFRPAVSFLVVPVIVFAVGAGLLLRLVIRAQQQRPSTGREALMGKGGVVETSLDPEGWVIVQGERWRARCADPLAAGERVRIVSCEGLLLRVQKEA